MIQLLQTPAAGARVPPGRGLQSAYLSAPTGRTKSALIITQDFSPGRPRSEATRSGRPRSEATRSGRPRSGATRSGATRSGSSSGRGVAYYAEKDTSKADILFQRSAAIPTCALPSASGPRCARPPLRSPLVFLLTIAHKKKDIDISTVVLQRSAATYSPTFTQYHRRCRA